MKIASTLIFALFFLFSCGKKEVEKENKEFKEPVVEIPVPKVDEITVPEIQEKVEEVIFTVQIAALRNQNENLIEINGMNTYQENGLTKYRLGSFETYKEARSFRRQMLNEYGDAFVQALKNDQPISILEALQ